MNLHGSFSFFWGRTQEALESRELDPASETVAHLTIGKVRNRSFLYTCNYDHRSFTKTGSGQTYGKLKNARTIGKVHGMAERNVEVCEQTLLCLFLMNIDHLLRQVREKCRENSTHQRFSQALASVRKTQPNLTQLKGCVKSDDLPKQARDKQKHQTVMLNKTRARTKCSSRRNATARRCCFVATTGHRSCRCRAARRQPRSNI